MSTGWQFKEIVAGNFIKDQISGDKSRVFLQRQLWNRQLLRQKIVTESKHFFLFLLSSGQNMKKNAKNELFL